MIQIRPYGAYSFHRLGCNHVSATIIARAMHTAVDISGWVTSGVAASERGNASESPEGQHGTTANSSVLMGCAAM